MVGNIPNFSKWDILRCFLLLHRNIGRKALAKELSLGEGTVRGILDILKSNGLLDSTKKGHFLSRKGNKVISGILAQISSPRQVKVKELYPELEKTGLVVRNPNAFSSTYKLRDIAVKNGAEGALILKFKKRLEAKEAHYQNYFRKLEDIFGVKKGDAVVLAFAENPRQAEIGALSIAAQLSSEVRNFTKEVQQ